jgi:hypothetical protein
MDRFRIRILDKDGNVVAVSSMMSPAAANAVTLEGGNVFVPHRNGSSK